MVSARAAKVSIPVALHLDHGTSYEQNVQCLRAGFTSLMYDGSKEPYEENVQVSEEICRMGHACVTSSPNDAVMLWISAP